MYCIGMNPIVFSDATERTIVSKHLLCFLLPSEFSILLLVLDFHWNSAWYIETVPSRFRYLNLLAQKQYYRTRKLLLG